MTVNNYEITEKTDGTFEVNNLKTSSKWRGVFPTFCKAWAFIVARTIRLKGGANGLSL